MIGQHMGLSEDVENMVSKKVIRDVRFKNMPVIHWFQILGIPRVGPTIFKTESSPNEWGLDV